MEGEQMIIELRAKNCFVFDEQISFSLNGSLFHLFNWKEIFQVFVN